MQALIWFGYDTVQVFLNTRTMKGYSGTRKWVISASNEYKLTDWILIKTIKVLPVSVNNINGTQNVTRFAYPIFLENNIESLTFGALYNSETLMK